MGFRAKLDPVVIRWPERFYTVMSTFNGPDPHQAIVYPDSDGRPIADNTWQFEWIVKITIGLESLFAPDPNEFVAGDLLWYTVEGKPKKRTAPDVMVVFGRPKGHRGFYRQWEEGGIAPHVVFEVLSSASRFGEMLRKFRFYRHYGVEEYYLYNPDEGFLEGYGRVKRRLKAIRRMSGFVSPRLGIRFEPGDGPNNLVILRPDGQRFLTYVEQVARSSGSPTPICRCRAPARPIASTPEAERQRAARLAARLRELGIEPD